MNFLLGVLIPPFVITGGPSVVIIVVDVSVDGVGVVVGGDVVVGGKVVVGFVGAFIVGAKYIKTSLIQNNHFSK